jgi:membrane-associated protease RseP (regulator of RpoE activity)
MYLLNLFSLFYSPDSFFKNVKKEPFQITLLFFITMLLIQILSALFGFIDLYFLLIYSIIIIVSLFIITFLIKIYSENADLNKVFISYVYSLTPLYILFIITSFVKEAFNYIIIDKPFILLILGVYIINLFSKGLKIICKIETGKTYSAIALFILFVYIIFNKGIGLEVIIFYSLVLMLLYFKRKTFTHQGIVLLYKSKLGLKSMNNISKKYPKILNFLAWIGIVLGFIIMLGMAYLLIDNAIKLIFVPNTMPAVAPILPGIPIPGSPINLPLLYGIISIFIVVVVHEFSHGVIARLHNIKVKSSGLFFMGPIIGAFIEPDEKQLDNSKIKHKLGVLGAGPLSNVILGGLVLLIIAFLLTPAFSNIVIEDGAKIKILDDSPAYELGLKDDMVINKINDTEIILFSDLLNYLNNTKPNDSITIYTHENEYNVILTEHPEKNNTGYLGVSGSQNFKLKEKYEKQFGNILLNSFLIINDFLFWLFVISLGIGVANLIPFGPADGGKMLYYILLRFYKEEKAKKISSSISAFFILLLLFILFFPLFKWIGNQFIF